MTWLEALILGLIQGLTEFLPVSSSGHIELGKALLGIEPNDDNLLFSIVVHAATALSTILIFRKDIAEVFKGLLRKPWNDSWDFSTKIVISMIPVGLIGILFEDEIEAFFDGRVLLVGGMLLFTGVLLAFTYRVRHREGGDVSYGRALLMGLAQAVAVLPGISRSGATIATGLLSGANATQATRFSFLMVLPPILGATLLKVKDYLEAPEATASLQTLPLVIGFLAAFLAGLAACQWMVALVRRGKLIYFALYCFIVGGIAIVATLV